MGAFKQTLPWHGSTVIEQVVSTLALARLREVVVITGHRRADVEAALARQSVRCVFNPSYATSEMLSSIQTGIAALDAGSDAVLVCLGDQPHMEATTLSAILAEGERTGWRQVIIPSYHRRAGHPILIPSYLYLQIMNATESLRSVLRNAPDSVNYLTLETPTILADLDTPADYAQATGSSAPPPHPREE